MYSVGTQMLTILKPKPPASDPDIIEAINRARELCADYAAEHISITIHLSGKAYVTIDAVPAGK